MTTKLHVSDDGSLTRQEQNPWRDYEIGDNEKLLNETIITLRLTKKHYKTAYTLVHMLGYKSLDE